MVPFSYCSLEEGVSESVIVGSLLEEPMLTSGSAVTRSEVQVSVDVHELMLDLVHHNESAYPPPLF